MAQFNSIKLTSKGLRLQAKAQTGTKLSFKGVVVGTGYLPENADVVQMTGLISPVTDAQTDIIGNKVNGDGFAQLEARISSGDTSFYLREIGVIATDPDEGDILYAYTNAGDYADFIPAAVNNITTQDIILITAIGNAEDVEVNITLDAEVGRKEFLEMKSDFAKKIDKLNEMMKFASITKLTANITMTTGESPGYVVGIASVNAIALTGNMPEIDYNTRSVYAADLDDLKCYCYSDGEIIIVEIATSGHTPATAVGDVIIADIPTSGNTITII